MTSSRPVISSPRREASASSSPIRPPNEAMRALAASASSRRPAAKSWPISLEPRLRSALRLSTSART